MAAKTYKVVKGDSLWKIAKTQFNLTSDSDIQKKVNALAKLNDLDNPNYIVVGQVLKLSGSSSSTTSEKSYAKPILKALGLLADNKASGGSDIMYVSWRFSYTGVKVSEYTVKWQYKASVTPVTTSTGLDKILSSDYIDGETKTVKASEALNATYSVPVNATEVKVTISVSATEAKPWYAVLKSASQTYHVGKPVVTPTVAPNISYDGDKTLTARLENVDSSLKFVQFKWVRDDNESTSSTSGKIAINTGVAETTLIVSTFGTEYKVCYRGHNGEKYGDWGPWSQSVETKPAAPTIKEIKSTGMSSVQVTWDGSKTAESYTLQWATKETDFDTTDKPQEKTGIEGTVWTVDVGSEGATYHFRVKAVKGTTESSWSKVQSITIGKPPAPPTTWSSTTTAVYDGSSFEPVTLYWIHNSEDNSKQTVADIEIYVDDELIPTSTITFPEDKEQEQINSKDLFELLPTSSDWINDHLTEGATIKWRVRTKGAASAISDWSVQRIVTIYDKPELVIAMASTVDGYPLRFEALLQATTQNSVGYSVTIVSSTTNSDYETTDNLGNTKVVRPGDVVYSKLFDISSSDLSAEISATDVNLEEGNTYVLTCTVHMDSGLTATQTREFTVSWTDSDFEPDAEITVDFESLSATIRPFCSHYPNVYYKVNKYTVGDADTYSRTSEILTGIEGETDGSLETVSGELVYVYTDASGNEAYFCIVASTESVLVEDVTLSVYRRDYDGGYTELAVDIPNTRERVISDPHPALDYARYRIVAKSTTTGKVSYTDVDSDEIGCKAVIIQWDEDWRTYLVPGDAVPADPAWDGSMLRLPFNVDVSDKSSPDVELIEYIGRSHPVSYYGTQLGVSTTWNTVIDKNDKETIYALRRLERWLGDVYVREPSGSGYWANITVSFNQKHNELTVPITINIARVEGGI